MKQIAVEFTSKDAKNAALTAAGIDPDTAVESEDSELMVEVSATQAQQSALEADSRTTYVSEL